jgi:hypothetical protein
VAQKDAQLAVLSGRWTKEPAEKDSELEPRQHSYAAPRLSQESLARIQTALEQAPTLIFLHLPKAAGTSFKAALLEMLPLGSVISDHPSGAPVHQVVRAVMAMAPEQRSGLRAVLAHVPYGLHTLFGEAQYVTILREPVARVLSNYYYAKSRTDFDIGKKIAAGMTIEQFAADVYSDNAQVRRLMKYTNISREDVFSDPPAGQLTRTHLEDAKDTLRRCAVVGLAERYDEFLDCVSAEFGLPALSCRDDNVTAIPWHRERLPERTIERLLEINRFDVELYEYAGKLAAEQVAKQAAKSTATRHMRPLYERASAREALEVENRRLVSELVGKAAEQAAEREHAAADMARHKEESARLTSERAAERDRFEAELMRQQGELSRQQGELSQQQVELSRQEAELARQKAELLRWQAESLRQQEENARLEAKLAATIDSLQLQLDRVYSSNSWKVTEPLRKLSGLRRKARLSR